MSHVIATPAGRAPAARDRDAADHADHDREPSRIWVLLQALACAGAPINPAAAPSGASPQPASRSPST
jgi:hypothetical protein